MSLLEKLYLRKKNNLAHYDQKLKVCNRNWYEYHKTELTEKEFDFILVDMNNLKFINDTYGHAMGDEILEVMTGIAKAIYHRPDDHIIRLGGDDYITDNNFSMVKTFVYLKVRLAFDPPTSTALIESMNNTLNELTWRLELEGQSGSS